jgi:hypothetical protein
MILYEVELAQSGRKLTGQLLCRGLPSNMPTHYSPIGLGKGCPVPIGRSGWALGGWAGRVWREGRSRPFGRGTVAGSGARHHGGLLDCVLVYRAGRHAVLRGTWKWRKRAISLALDLSLPECGLIGLWPGRHLEAACGIEDVVSCAGQKTNY